MNAIVTRSAENVLSGYKLYDLDPLVSCSGNIFKISLDAESGSVELTFGRLEAEMIIEALSGLLKPAESELSPAQRGATE